MKNIKILLVLLISISFKSYAQNVVFDNQDNTVKINNINYPSWNFTNDIPANFFFGIKINSDEDIIVIKSNYTMLNITANNFSSDYDIDYSYDRKTAHITYYNLNEHVFNDLLFKFNILYKKRKRKLCTCDLFGKKKHYHKNMYFSNK